MDERKPRAYWVLANEGEAIFGTHVSRPHWFSQPPGTSATPTPPKLWPRPLVAPSVATRHYQVLGKEMERPYSGRLAKWSCARSDPHNIYKYTLTWMTVVTQKPAETVHINSLAVIVKWLIQWHAELNQLLNTGASCSSFRWLPLSMVCLSGDFLVTHVQVYAYEKCLRTSFFSSSVWSFSSTRHPFKK